MLTLLTKKPICLLIFLSSYTLSLFSQTSNHGDSLKLVAIEDNVPIIKFNKEKDYAQYLVSISIDSAINYLDSIMIGYKGNNNYSYARVLSLKSWYLAYQAKYEESIRISHQALELQLKEKTDTQGIGLTLNRIGIANLQFGRYEDSREYLLKALKYFKSTDDEERIDLIYNNMGVLESELRNPLESIKYYKKSLALRQKLNKPFWEAYSYFNIGQSYYNLEESDSFEKYILKAVSTFKNKTKNGVVPAMVKFGLANYYENKGNLKESIALTQSAIKQSEKINNTEMVVFGKRNLADFYYQNKQYKEAYDTYDAFYEMSSQLDSINNTSKVAEIEEKYQNAENKVQIATLKASNLESQNAVQRLELMVLISTLIALLIGATSIFLFYRKKQKNKLIESKLKGKLEELKLIALRSQMNPHFLFNCINTAQNFVLNTEKQDAYEYLEKFAKLLRKVLDNSTKLYISLEDETAQLKLYLELEKTRFNQGFDYSFSIDEDLEGGHYEIPAMVLQPFIENALIHGVLNLENKRGVISISLKKQDQRLHVEITDNGVGRKKALEIKQQKEKRYKSIALPNITERLKIMQDNDLGEIFIKIEDLFEGNKPSGTFVSIDLPLN